LKSHTEYLTFHTKKRRELVHLTPTLAAILERSEKLAPERPDYRHHATGEDNGDAHLKSMLVHHEVIVPVTKGKMDLGPWQRVFYAEFDGQRDKRVIVKVLGD
jgi:secondary thiamine-phosphate synthase enzyme